MSFFGLDNPHHMLAKAKRERARLAQEIDVDNIFNFFVTVGHIPDYVGRRSDVPQHALDTLRRNPSIKLARDLCDTGKHVELNKSGRTTASGAAYENSIFGAPFGAWNFGPQKVNWMVHSQGRFIGVLVLADELLSLWESFFQENGLNDVVNP